MNHRSPPLWLHAGTSAVSAFTDVLGGFRAVILERIAVGNLDAIRDAICLFNDIFECSLDPTDNQNSRSNLSLRNASEFVPWLIDSLVESVERLKQTSRLDPYEKRIGEKFEPLKPLLETLHRTVHQDGWPRNNLILVKALLIVDRFIEVVEEAWLF